MKARKSVLDRYPEDLRIGFMRFINPSASTFGAVLGRFLQFKNLGAEILKWTCSPVIGISYPILSVHVKGSSDTKQG